MSGSAPGGAQQPARYGGQAVIEGVLMRGAALYCVAVRTPQGEILVDTQSLGVSSLRTRLGRWPLLRGLIVLWDALVIGTRALTYSANAQATSANERIEGAPLAITLVGSLVAGLALFLLLPAAVGHLIQTALGWPHWAANLTEGIFRLVLLVGYIAAIGRLPEIRRVFGYHGAEHQTISAFEAGETLTPASVAPYPLEHPRCGTAFLLTVAVLSILLFSALGPMPLLPRLGYRLLLVPVLAGLSYEYLRLTGKYRHSWLSRALTWPNLALQRLTTRPPAPEMVEVALAAFQALRRAELDQAGGPSSS
ncbi:MAG TPA: DUF1385 domain-containing protein [Anaerolineales bacterium]